MLPTQKDPHLFPRTLDHFKCYRVAEGTPDNSVVNLIDQFHEEDNVLVGNPAVFCNPVVKVHGPKIFKIKHPEAHLTCYTISSAHPVTVTPSVHNQFGDETLSLNPANILCVPSQKLSWTGTVVP